MKRLQICLSGLMLLFGCGLLCACVESVQAKVYNPQEEVITKTYDIKDFYSIQAGGALKIKYEQSATFSVEARSSKAMLDILKVENQAGVLRLGLTKSLRRWSNDIEVTVKAPELRHLNVSGACSFTAGDITLKTDARIDVSGASKAALGTIKCNALYVDQSGASNLNGFFVANGEVKMENSGASTCKGTVNATGMMRISNTGTSSLNMAIKAPRIIARSSGASGCTIHVDCDELEYDNTGASHITISGRAKKVNKKSSGLSKETYKDFKME